MKQHREGRVVRVDPNGQRGVIEIAPGDELPFHSRDLAFGERLFTGDVVRFRPGQNRYGRRTALEIERIGWEDTPAEDDAPREWEF